MCRGKGQGARGKGQRARGKGQRARGKGQGAKSKEQRAGSKGQGAKGREHGAGSKGYGVWGMREFECRRCGNCCAVRGYVRLNDDDVDAISEYLGMSVYDFTKSYTRLIKNRQQLTLIERADGACVFLQKDRTCLVNDVKPMQCRNFPHKWRYDGYEEICEGMLRRAEG